MGISRWLRKLTASVNDLEVLDAIDGAAGSSIEALAENVTARIIGTVEALDSARLRSPVSNREVIGWGYKIESLDVNSRQRMCPPFALVEGESRAIIDPEHARLLISATAFGVCHGVDDDPTLAPLLRRAGATDTVAEGFGDKPIRLARSTYVVSEWGIQPGMRLAVVGRGVRVNDPRATDGYRGNRTMIQISGLPDEPLAITDEI